MGSLWFKLWRASAAAVLDPADLVKLRYDDGGADRLLIPPGADAQRWLASLADLRAPLEALARLRPADATGGGSNNWAVAPGRTTTGRPLLAGDPHRAFELPGMYAQMHLACDEFDAIGFTVPGVPGFPHFGHNEHVAWGVTHALADIHDLYVEQFDPADPERYLHRGDWLTVATRTEEIAVRDGPPVSVDVTETRHGPVIAGDPAAGAALTLKSVQFAVTDRSFDCLMPMLARDLRPTFPSRPRLGTDRSQPGRGRHRRPHRPPCPRRGAAPPGGQRLAAGAGVDRRVRVGRHDPRGPHAPGRRPGARVPRHREQPRGHDRPRHRRLLLHRRPPAGPGPADRGPAGRAGAGGPVGHDGDPRRRRQRARPAVPVRAGGHSARSGGAAQRPGPRGRGPDRGLGPAPVPGLRRGRLLHEAALGPGPAGRQPIGPGGDRGQRADAAAAGDLRGRPGLVDAAGPAAVR